MKILAVIPTCEGASSLPNKNFRVIGGKPLIYYVINNALSSRYVSDVLVTSNSEAIITIARQMGVKTHRRGESLSNKNVALDPVIYDACNQVDITEYDYIVTMQSISPAARAETLDRAIEQCVEEEWDTVISVANKAHFYWQGEVDAPVPFHGKRANRHALPPFYVETGAFLITKTKFVTEHSRLGEKIKLYELCSDEAVDVYTFGDLKQVENILCKKSVAFYVNGNNPLGLGHIYRVKELADEFFTKPDIYYDKNQTHVSAFGETTHSLIPVDGESGLMEALRRREYHCFINDILCTTAGYMEALRLALPGAKIINYEDEGEGAALADLVINDIYENVPRQNARAGHIYFLASKLFLLCSPIEIKPAVKNVLVAFGGADPSNYTERLLNIIKPYTHLRFYVVIGGAKQNAGQLLAEYGGIPHIEILHNISNMPEVMSRCDVAVTSRGRTGFELALLGIPSVSIAQNRRESLHTFISGANGFIYLGENPDDAAIGGALERLFSLSAGERTAMQNKMLKNDLRSGRKHVMALIDELVNQEGAML